MTIQNIRYDASCKFNFFCTKFSLHYIDRDQKTTNQNVMDSFIKVTELFAAIQTEERIAQAIEMGSFKPLQQELKNVIEGEEFRKIKELWKTTVGFSERSHDDFSSSSIPTVVELMCYSDTDDLPKRVYVFFGGLLEKCYVDVSFFKKDEPYLQKIKGKKIDYLKSEILKELNHEFLTFCNQYRDASDEQRHLLLTGLNEKFKTSSLKCRQDSTKQKERLLVENNEGDVIMKYSLRKQVKNDTQEEADANPLLHPISTALLLVPIAWAAFLLYGQMRRE